jgi:hypothetical protein
MLFQLIVLLCLLSPNADARSIRMLAFDWDGNLAHLPTNVVLFNKNNGAEKIIEGKDFARARGHLEEFYPGFEIRINRDHPEKSSFRFTDSLDENHFLNSLKIAVADPNNISWQQKQWPRFVQALNDPETQPYVSIITSRGHSPEQVMEGLRFLRALGYLRVLPELVQIHTVSYMHGPHRAINNTAAKIAVIGEQLDWLSAQDEGRHFYEFSDDSSSYIEPIKTHIQRQKRRGRWSNVDIVIVQTLGESQDSWRIDRFGCTKELVSPGHSLTPLSASR